MSDSGNPEVLVRLAQTIAGRKRDRPERSYVVGLLDGGIDAMGAKITEEAAEVLEAAREAGTEHLVYETADLLFHLWVLLGSREVSPDAVFSELARRFGTSGITEKERRPSQRPAVDG